jgi:hypothetical protein
MGFKADDLRRGVGEPNRTDWLVGLMSGPGTSFERGADKPREDGVE